MWRCSSLILLFGAIGCSSPPKNPPEIAADTELACACSDAAAWSQIVFRTDAWNDLARRADAGEAQAFDRIADHMQAQLDAGDSACNAERIARLRDTARRLREAPRPKEEVHVTRGSPPPAEPTAPDAAATDATGVEQLDAGEPAPGEGGVVAETQRRPPGVASGIPTVRLGDGRFAVYRRVLSQSRARFRRCYEGALSRHETVALSVIEFSIAPDGHVDQTSFAKGDTFFDQCMDAAFKSLRFPEEPGRITIRYPLTELPH